MFLNNTSKVGLIKSEIYTKYIERIYLFVGLLKITPSEPFILRLQDYEAFTLPSSPPRPFWSQISWIPWSSWISWRCWTCSPHQLESPLACSMHPCR